MYISRLQLIDWKVKLTEKPLLSSRGWAGHSEMLLIHPQRFGKMIAIDRVGQRVLKGRAMAGTNYLLPVSLRMAQYHLHQPGLAK